MTNNEKALEALTNIVIAYCMALGMEPPVPDVGSQTEQQADTIRTALSTPALNGEALEKVKEAILQILDDGGYINDADEIVIAGDRTEGGCFCHAAGIQLIEALTLLSTLTPRAGSEAKGASSATAKVEEVTVEEMLKTFSYLTVEYLKLNYPHGLRVIPTKEGKDENAKNQSVCMPKVQMSRRY